MRQSSYGNWKIPNSLRNLKCEIRSVFPKPVLARTVNCTLNMETTFSCEHFCMSPFRLFACLFVFLFCFCFAFQSKIVSMEVSILILLFPVIDIPILARGLFFTSRVAYWKKRNYIPELHEKEFLNIFISKHT